MNVLYRLGEDPAATAPQTSRPNAFAILMSSGQERRLPKIIEGEQLRGDQKLRNAVLNVLEKNGIGWSPQYVSSLGESCVNQLTAALWYLDTHHDTLKERGLGVPKELSHLSGFNDWQRKKIKKPQLSVQGLDGHIQSLSRLISQPWLAKAVYSQLRAITESLNDAMYKYKEYLLQQRKRVLESQQRSEPARSLEGNLEMRTLPATEGPVKECYTALYEHLQTLEYYQEVSLDDFSPEDRYSWRHWVEKLQMPFPSMIYRFPYGNNLGVVSFIWKIPHECDQTQIARLISKLNEKQYFFATRDMRRDFIDRYNQHVKIPQSVLRNIYRTLTDDASAAVSGSQREIDERVEEALSMDDPDILLDLRKLNGNAKSSKFDAFWDELATYIEELNPAVDERRHSQVLHMPVAISLRHLRDTIKERLQQKHPNDEDK